MLEYKKSSFKKYTSSDIDDLKKDLKYNLTSELDNFCFNFEGVDYCINTEHYGGILQTPNSIGYAGWGSIKTICTFYILEVKDFEDPYLFTEKDNSSDIIGFFQSEVIHYTSDQTYFHCKEFLESEVFERFIIDKSIKKEYNKNQKEKKRRM